MHYPALGINCLIHFVHLFLIRLLNIHLISNRPAHHFHYRHVRHPSLRSSIPDSILLHIRILYFIFRFWPDRHRHVILHRPAIFFQIATILSFTKSVILNPSDASMARSVCVPNLTQISLFATEIWTKIQIQDGVRRYFEFPTRAILRPR